MVQISTCVAIMALHSQQLLLQVITRLYRPSWKMVQMSTLILVSIKLHLIRLVPKVIKRLYGSCWIMEQMSMFKLSLAVHLKKLLGEVIRRLCSSCWIRVQMSMLGVVDLAVPLRQRVTHIMGKKKS